MAAFLKIAYLRTIISYFFSLVNRAIIEINSFISGPKS